MTTRGEVRAPRLVYAVDIGGTSTRVALVTRDGTIERRARIDTDPGRGIEDCARRIGELAQAVATEAGANPRAAGISSAGPIDPTTGVYEHPPNLPGWHGQSMLPALHERLGVPVVAGHDATLAAVAETRYGAHHGAQNLVYLTVSTGIGAGIVAGGRAITGSRGGAGEAGHMIVNPGGPPCGAGCPGCLEGSSSGPAIAAEAQRRMAAGAQSALPASPTAIAVFRAAEDGDALANEVIGEAIGHLASGIAGLLAIFDPEVLVLGGGVAEGLAKRWDVLLDEVRLRALPRYRDGVPLDRTTLGDDASLLGAAVIAVDALASH